MKYTESNELVFCRVELIWGQSVKRFVIQNLNGTRAFDWWIDTMVMSSRNPLCWISKVIWDQQRSNFENIVNTISRLSRTQLGLTSYMLFVLRYAAMLNNRWSRFWWRTDDHGKWRSWVFCGSKFVIPTPQRMFSVYTQLTVSEYSGNAYF